MLSAQLPSQTSLYTLGSASMQTQTMQLGQWDEFIKENTFAFTEFRDMTQDEDETVVPSPLSLQQMHLLLLPPSVQVIGQLKSKVKQNMKLEYSPQDSGLLAM